MEAKKKRTGENKVHTRKGEQINYFNETIIPLIVRIIHGRTQLS